MSFVANLVNPPNRDAALLVGVANQSFTYLLDCGSLEPLGNLAKQRVRRVFITHGHIDHTIGLDSLLRCQIYASEPLEIYGPPGIVEQVGHRLQSYAWNLTGDSPFRVRAHELGAETVRSQVFPCARQFQPGESSIVEATSLDLTEGCRLDWAPVDHGVPCLAYALTWPGAVTFEAERARTDGFPPGPWVGQLKSAPESVEVQGVSGVELARRYLSVQPDQKLAYVTDTLLGEEQRRSLLALVGGARELWCESNYLEVDRELACHNLHATATQAALLAREAGVEALRLFHISRRYGGPLVEQVEEAQRIFPATRLG